MATNRPKRSKPKATRRKRPTKVDAVLKLLRRDDGASIAELRKVTGWQPHSVRAALSGLRKKDHDIRWEKSEKGVTVYKTAER